MSGKRETERLVRDLRAQGFTVELTGGNHWKVWKPGEEGCAFMSYTPSDHRSVKNAITKLRRIGYDHAPEHRKRKKRKK